MSRQTNYPAQVYPIMTPEYQLIGRCMSTLDRWPAHYRIRIEGHLDMIWSAWFDDLTITQEADGTTMLAGSLVDQAALYGLLSRLRDLGATLLAVERLAPDDPRSAALHCRIS